MIFRQDVPSRYRAPVSPSRRLARSALPRERFRSLTLTGNSATTVECPLLAVKTDIDGPAAYDFH